MKRICVRFGVQSDVVFADHRFYTVQVTEEQCNVTTMVLIVALNVLSVLFFCPVWRTGKINGRENANNKMLRHFSVSCPTVNNVFYFYYKFTSLDFGGYSGKSAVEKEKHRDKMARLEAKIYKRACHMFASQVSVADKT
jgi:hypothetical protein